MLPLKIDQLSSQKRERSSICSWNRLVLWFICLFSLIFFTGLWLTLPRLAIFSGSYPSHGSNIPASPRSAIATLVTDMYPSGYVCGAIVLARSIRKIMPSVELVAMTTVGVDEQTKVLLKSEGYSIRQIDSIPHPKPQELRVSRFMNTYSKLAAWTLIEYNKVRS